MDIARNSVVTFHYHVATNDGATVDTSQGGEPMAYLHGHGHIVPGLEEAMAGHRPGDRFEVTLPPEKAYGVSDGELDMRLPLDVFPGEARAQLKPGFQFMAEHPNKDGESVLFTVHAIEDSEALVSGNHELAGATLVFKIEVIDVRVATPEELTHGHAHGAGGHHH